MELVSGRSLADTLPPGGLPLARLLTIGIAIADAVAAAHQRASRTEISSRRMSCSARASSPVASRCSTSGSRKRFSREMGLEKLASRIQCNSPTITSPAWTQQRSHSRHRRVYVARTGRRAGGGRALGSVSLGVVLYEMATGQRPFPGETNLSILSSILQRHTQIRNRDQPGPSARFRADRPPGACQGSGAPISGCQGLARMISRI